MIDLRVKGDFGLLKVFNPTGPHSFNRVPLTLHRARGSATSPGPAGAGEGTHVLVPAAGVPRPRCAKAPPCSPRRPTPSPNMRVIDAIYTAAGMLPRLPTPVPA